MSLKESAPELLYKNPNDFYTQEEAERYNQSPGMRRAQESLTLTSLMLSKPVSQDLNINILDIGCGSGFSLDFLRKKGYANLKGIDVSKEMLKLSKIKKLNVKLGGFQDLNKITEKFDLIISLSALQWFISNKSEGEIKNLIKKMSRELDLILKKPGCVVFQFYVFSEQTFYLIFHAFRRTFQNSEVYIENPDSSKKKKYFIVLRK